MLFGILKYPSLEGAHMIPKTNTSHSHELTCFPGLQQFPNNKAYVINAINLRPGDQYVFGLWVVYMIYMSKLDMKCLLA